jgi:hypothetical protein
MPLPHCSDNWLFVWLAVALTILLKSAPAAEVVSAQPREIELLSVQPREDKRAVDNSGAVNWGAIRSTGTYDDPLGVPDISRSRRLHPLLRLLDLKVQANDADWFDPHLADDLRAFEWGYWRNINGKEVLNVMPRAVK